MKMPNIGEVFDKVKDIVTSIPRSIDDDNWFSLPNWMRRHTDDIPHQGENEKRRRRVQIMVGFLKDENRGTIKKIAPES